MASTTNLKLALPVTGSLTGTWGTTVNDSITSLLDSAVAGTTTLSVDDNISLSDTPEVANTARQAIILWTASNGATTRTITAPARSKVYVVINAGTGPIIFRGDTPTTGVTIATGETAQLVWNGSDFIKVFASSGLVFLAAVTPTAAANVDFLSTFSANYDNYLILGQDIKFSASDTLRMRFAVAGTADSGSNYVNNANGPGINASTLTTSFAASNTVYTTGRGCTFNILVSNVNDTSIDLKSIDVSAISNDSATVSSIIYLKQMNGYFAANAVSGFRLFANGGSNFAASGSVRVYGYKNS
jgi:hypothetical protein